MRFISFVKIFEFKTLFSYIVETDYARTSNTSRTYTSEVSFWLDEVESTNYYEQTYGEISVELSCVLSSGSQTVVYSIASYNGSTPPDWVSVDSVNSKLTFTPPDISVDTNYTFSVDTTIVETSEVYQKPVTLSVLS